MTPSDLESLLKLETAEIQREFEKTIESPPHIIDKPVELNIRMNGRELVENCTKNVSDLNSIGNTCITGDDLGPPRPPSPPRVSSKKISHCNKTEYLLKLRYGKK